MEAQGDLAIGNSVRSSILPFLVNFVDKAQINITDGAEVTHQSFLLLSSFFRLTV